MTSSDIIEMSVANINRKIDIKPYFENCGECGKLFRYKAHYLKHVEGHKRNECNVCGARLTSRRQLVLHIKEKHKMMMSETSFQCKFCKLYFVKRLTLYRHFNVHAGGRHVCLKCGQFIESKEEYDAHVSKHEEMKLWKCDTCDQSFYRRQHFMNHIKSHGKYKCQVCDEKFTTKRKVERHEHIRHKLRRKPVLQSNWCCSKYSSHKDACKTHSKDESDNNDGKFSSDNPVFTEGKSLAISFYNTHPEEEDRSVFLKNPGCVCKDCNRVFSNEEELKSHLEKPKKDARRSYICDTCGYSTKKRDNFVRHTAIHDVKRNYICEQCGKPFNSINNLKDHQTYHHIDDRLFACDLCDKAFKRNCQLNRHMIQSHSNFRPFKCHCGLAYKRMFHLQRHKNVTHNAKEPIKEISVSPIRNAKEPIKEISKTPTCTAKEPCPKIPKTPIKKMPETPVVEEKLINADDNLNWVEIEDELNNMLKENSRELITLHSAPAYENISASFIPNTTTSATATLAHNIVETLEIPCSIELATSHFMPLSKNESETMFSTPYTLSFDLPPGDMTTSFDATGKDNQENSDSKDFPVFIDNSDTVNLPENAPLPPFFYISVPTSVSQ